ncbi:hypothetical protein D7Z94_14135 [Ulvibacterium marinum]|uniref:Uncharacterized protein n=1 Tax=Ulvibacterium marinum TaxID=2419782 RepID=A0A3B0C5N4_9FLAO|nr:hypothetical protein D7Z94_14135 [Ulvibacterium marinum]
MLDFQPFPIRPYKNINIQLGIGKAMNYSQFKFEFGPELELEFELSSRILHTGKPKPLRNSYIGHGHEFP